VTFRVLDGSGNAVRPLTSDDITVINDEKGEPFGAGMEGGGVSDPGFPSDSGLYTVLALDMSDSIFNSGSVDDVIDGALTFVDLLVTRPAEALRHTVALIAFGSPDETAMIHDFTSDDTLLISSLEQLRNSSGRGATDLYGTYMMAIDAVEEKGRGIAIVEQSVVIVTDGTHEAGDEENMRKQALSAKSSSSAVMYSIGIQGAYDEKKLEELASSNGSFISVENASQLSPALADIADKVGATARSNYVVGVCTPVAYGTPSLTIEITADGATARETVAYSVSELNGDVANCDPAVIANYGFGLSTTTTTISGAGTTTTTTTSGGGETTAEDLGMTFVSLPGGTFQMGCSDGDDECDADEYPQHAVTLSPFKMSAYEVTQGQWEQVMGSNPSYFSSCGSDCPVEKVSWTDVQAFIRALNSQTGESYRLPTEAEWEYAARAGTTTKYYCGDDASCLAGIAWYGNNSGGITHPVGQKIPNAWGLYDMSGNVREWVFDRCDSNYYEVSPLNDPQGPESGCYRVIRGGSWSPSARRCRSSYRDGNGPSNDFHSLGFRLVLP